MPLITPADLATRIYPEAMNEITRNDDSIVITAIAAAEQEAKLYLSRFDLVQLFGTDATAPAVADSLLASLVKDIAVWHLVRLSACGIDNAACRTAYEDAMKILKNISDGQAIPFGWPYLQTPSADLPDGDAICWSSNARRSNYY